jgi:protein-S-isoprenylcysteine O-methyltransferase Ste14
VSRLPDLGRRGEGYVALQALLVLAVLGTVPLGPVWAGVTRIVGAIVGVVLMAGGAWLVLRGIVDLRENLTLWPRPRDASRLIDTGAYRLVRHPIYGGQVIGALGLGLLAASPVTILAVLGLALLFSVKSRREEAWLLERHPEYAAYRARTRRLIPWLY